ncbi:hypothetical protein LCGC14_1267780 [marine sediment metagenome]|uniref:Uncharacterized protein n=1 Tax=marine sediment metagenome TaxID=412755 RepID=A0A0F9P253_9ZZZZ
MKEISVRRSFHPGKDYFLFVYDGKNQAANGEHLTKDELKALGKKINIIFRNLGEPL